MKGAAHSNYQDGATDFLREAQEALWMVDDGVSKNQGQRKRRDTCINNVRLKRVPRQIDHATYTKRPRDKFQRGSLENVSSNPWGELYVQEQSSLRRTRSLAITRDDVFSNTEISGNNKPRRAQLIPRAKLIEKNPRYAIAKDNLKLPQQQQQALIKRKSATPDYSPPSARDRNGGNRDIYSSTNNLLAPKFIIGAEQDSLDSNYHNKSSINTGYRVSYEDLPGLSLPNYYPDAKYDTDNTDNISLITDNFSSESCGNSKKFYSCENISIGKWTVNEPSIESIPYDDNIVLSANRPLYDSFNENLNRYAKPRTIRGPTPYKRENQIYYSKDKRRSLGSSSDTSEEKPTSDKISLDYFETDSNFDEINLNNENITKIIQHKIEEKAEESQNSPTPETKEQEQAEKVEEEYKTIVTVEHEPDPVIIEKSIKEESEEEKNKHSHNYLREFLESQKGSKKPLQNFLTKKFSNLSRKNSKVVASNLIDNRFHSLPDITVGKSLRKCEKIDRKLRKCDKRINNLNNNNSGESRFIVNIGKHFDITANNIPVDFELKIAKVPKKNKSKNTTTKSEEDFVEAVKNLKETLNNNPARDENQNILDKPEIVAVQEKLEATQQEQPEMNLNGDNKECTKEYHEKLGTMRNYWNKMANGNSSCDENNEKIEDNNTPTKCKIVDVRTKIVDVKKVFEPSEIKESENPNKVQLVKQFFEKKPEKTEKKSQFIKDSCSYFENSNPRDSSSQFESLNPNIVEIINKESANKEKPIKHKPVSKSKSITYPEFDHVRYRVVKSDLFQKKIFANCEKESQFDGLMQYLQDYSFQELLRDNNIVIIEPIRTKIQHEKSPKSIKSTKNITPLLCNNKSNDQTDSNGLRRHFFYHPIRVNKEVNEDELPNPDTVKQVRQFFESNLKRSQSSEDFQRMKLDPDKDICSGTDSNSNRSSNISDYGSQENLYDSITECCEQQYVSEDILKKIRECGTTVTYYGGRVVKKQLGDDSLTRVIMEEIKNNEKRSNECNCPQTFNNDSYQGVKFRLVKSNSCNSRLELVGTNDLTESKRKYLKNKENQLKNVQEIKEESLDKNKINENIKNADQPKIIGEERKITWSEQKEKKTYNGISFSNKPRQKITDYHNYDNFNTTTKKIDDMEFEPYEVA